MWYFQKYLISPHIFSYIEFMSINIIYIYIFFFHVHKYIIVSIHIVYYTISNVLYIIFCTWWLNQFLPGSLTLQGARVESMDDGLWRPTARFCPSARTSSRRKSAFFPRIRRGLGKFIIQKSQIAFKIKKYHPRWSRLVFTNDKC